METRAQALSKKNRMELILPLTPPKSTFTPNWQYGAKE